MVVLRDTLGLCAQVEFWKELAQPEPNFHTLEALGSDIATSIQLADSCFGDILRLSPHSLPALRSYAKFLLEVPEAPSFLPPSLPGVSCLHVLPMRCSACCGPSSSWLLVGGGFACIGGQQSVESPADAAEGRGAGGSSGQGKPSHLRPSASVPRGTYPFACCWCPCWVRLV